MTTEVTEAMVDAVDWNSSHPFPAYQQNPAAWMNAIVAWAIKRSIAEIRREERRPMAVKDLIATQGEIAASRITRKLDFNSTDVHERLFAEIQSAVDSAVDAERERFSLAPRQTELADALRAVVMAYEVGVADGAAAIRARGDS